MKRQCLSPSLALVCGSLLFSGCGGGGGLSIRSGSSFTNWSAIVPPQTVTVSGMSTESTYEAPAPDFLVTDIGTARESRSSSATLTYGADGFLTRVRIRTPFSSVSWDKHDGDLVETDSGVVLLGNAAETALGLAADPFAFGWNFQTFGAWITGLGTGAGRAGAISIGAPSPGDGVPDSGSAIFTGLTLGHYVDTAGEAYSTASNLRVEADFFDRELDFRTNNTAKLNLLTLMGSDADNLDLTGTLTYALGSSAFSGAVAGDGLDGTAKGRFYGPRAQELGGYFNLRGTGVEAYSGAFGADRP